MPAPIKYKMRYSKNAVDLIKTSREMILLLDVHVNHFPKHEKYSLCQKVRQTMYAVHSSIIKCEGLHNNRSSLKQLNVEHEQLRSLVNLAFELGYYNHKNGKNKGFSASEELRRYTAMSSIINKIGEMIGGWARSLHTVTIQ